MGKINVLSFAVANLIAAGEVVDRPSSVIKELVENAIDAGATRITVEIQHGGVTFMRVTDNGCGIEKDDLPVAIRRHATSKIKDETDLNTIMTLGFRGEALAAIAAVSDVRIISKTANAENGAALEVSGGVIIGIGERAAQNGTTVIVENLFANVPARRKFLKKDMTETMSVTAVVEKISLSHPEIAFKLITDGTVRLETVGDGKLMSAIYAIFGRDFSKALLEINSELEGIKISGYCGRTDNCKVNRNFQNFFINGRYVKSRTAQAAIEQAYVSYIAPERFPVCVINIEINPSLVDVNVHPSKLEVKFSNEKPVFEAIYYAIRATLEQNTTRPEMRLEGSLPNISASTLPNNRQFGPKMSERTEPIREGREESLKKRQLGYDVVEATPAAKPEKSEKKPKTEEVKSYFRDYMYEAMAREKEKASQKKLSPEETKEEKVSESTPIHSFKDSIPKQTADPVTEPINEPIVEEKKEEPIVIIPDKNPEIKSDVIIEKNEKPSMWRIVGEVFNSYVIVERGDRMILIDKHAAHERIIFERLKENMKKTGITSQMLMLPVATMLTGDEINILEQYRSEIESIGFGFTTGRNSVSIFEIPEGIDMGAASDMLAEIATRALDETGTPNITRDIVFEKALYQASCKAAIKAGREYSLEDIKALVAELMRLPDVTFCPHGRPIAMELSKAKIDRQFSRT